MPTRRHVLAASAAVPIALLPVHRHAWAQPADGPIRIIVPSPAGSPVDAVARRLGELLAKALAANVIVDNKSGAMGTIGAAEVARAAPDGRTLLFTTPDPLVSATAMLKSLPYDARAGFTPISKVATSAPALVAHPRVKANSLTELIAQMKTEGNSLSYGSWGPGTIPMQVMESAARQAGVRFQEVPYRGGPPALQDLLAGAVDLTFTAPFLAAPLIADGKLKALALVGAKRSELMPQVQTFGEAGFTAFVYSNEIWVGLLAPAKLDAALRRKLGDVVQAAVRGPELSAYLSAIGFTPVGNLPDEFDRQLVAERAAIPQLLRELGLQPQ